MSRIFLILFLVGLLALGIGFLGLGAFPPGPHTQPVEKILPNTQFQPKS